MELPHIGKHCSIKSCNLLDFLPFNCDICKKVFCKDHYEYEKHDCKEAFTRDVQVPVCPLCNKPIPVRKNQIADVVVGAHIDQDCQSLPAKNKRKTFKHRCSMRGCKQNEMIEVKCPKCHLNFCLRHRHEKDHQCEVTLKSNKLVVNQRASSSRHNLYSSSNYNPQKTLMSTMGSDLNRLREERRQQNIQASHLNTEDADLARAIEMSLKDSNMKNSQEEADLALARQLQKEEDERRGGNRSRNQTNKDENSTCSVS